MSEGRIEYGMIIACDAQEFNYDQNLIIEKEPLPFEGFHFKFLKCRSLETAITCPRRKLNDEY